MSEMLESPVFIVGSVRSGTTLLRLMLGRHSGINCFGEFEQAVSQADGDSWPPLDEYYRFLSLDRQSQAHGFQVNHELAYVELVQDFLKQAAARKPCSVVSAAIHSRIDLIQKIWPDARYIHLVRDPRDVALSCVGMGWVGNPYMGLEYWLDAEKRWDLVFKNTDSKNIYEIKYEEFVASPEIWLENICGFLNVPFEKQMLDIEGSTSYSNPDPKFMNQWTNKLDSKELGWIENRCQQLLLDRGYQLSGAVLKKPSDTELFKLSIQNRLSRIVFNIRKWGFINWFGFVVSKKLGIEALQARYQVKINEIDIKYLK